MDWSTIILGFMFLRICFVAVICYRLYNKYFKNLPKPKYDLNEYWGKGEVKTYEEDKSIKPFRILYSNEVITKLKSRLEDAGPFADPLENINFEYGFNSKRLQEVINYWKDSYIPKWNERQDFLNQFNHFKTQIQGLNIHFIHVKPKVKEGTKVFPLLLLHGWPGSIREFYEIIPLLTTPSKENIAFEVVVPSLPGFGFSEGASKKGFTPDKISVIMRNLMVRLNLNKFYIQAGDWGSIIGSDLSALYPENILGYHTNYISIRTVRTVVKTIIASFFPSFFIEHKKYIDWIFPLSREIKFIMEETGYLHEQATKPDTIGIVLSNNPVGLAAWILEKFSTLTKRDYRQLADGGFENDFSLDALIDNIMIYYLTNSATTSGRIYKEMITREYPMDRVAVTTPVGCAHFRHEAQHQFNFLTKERFKNIIHNGYHEHGGHFAALQLPKVLHQDFIDFVKKTL